MTSAVTFRDIQEPDLPFLRRVYASTREDELALVDWSGAEKDAFLNQQFHAQHVYYQQQFPDASYQVIVAGTDPAGRLYLDRRSDELRIIDIAILPEYRNQGIGSAILRDLLSEAAAAHKPVRIHVEMHNRALRFYERLGFRRSDAYGVYYLMEWTPAEHSRGADAQPTPETEDRDPCESRTPLRRIHRDQRGAVTLETILIIGAIAIPILIFIVKFGWPRIRDYFFRGMQELEQESDRIGGTGP